MYSHVHIGTTDLPRAIGFYAVVLDPLGLTMKFADEARGWAGWMRTGEDRPLFLVGHAFDGAAHVAGNGQMVSLLAASRAVVDRCHALALVAGAVDEGGPGVRPEYHEHYYGAYFRDLDGNKLCVCCHDAG